LAQQEAKAGRVIEHGTNGLGRGSRQLDDLAQGIVSEDEQCMAVSQYFFVSGYQLLP
jgi:hypothetical protein